MDKTKVREIYDSILDSSYKMALRQVEEATKAFNDSCQKPISESDFRIKLQAMILSECLYDGVMSLIREVDDWVFDPADVVPSDMLD